MDLASARTYFFRHRAALSWGVGGTIAGMVIALIAYGIFNAIWPAGAASRELGLVLTISVLVSLPLAAACGSMAAKTAFLKKQAQKFAQNDGLTSCLNESTFSALVDTYSNRNAASGGNPLGAILLIHLDDLKIINARFGFSWGNEALSSVAATIRNTVRNGDIVGRLAGGQFGVFLPGADEGDARGVAERIHDNVSKTQFYPTGVQYPMSIRAGAVIVSSRIGFDDLLREAEGTLAMTQGPGRDWIEYQFVNVASLSDQGDGKLQ